MTEIIYLKVKVKINYQSKTTRKEAIRKAKRCVTATDVYALDGAKTISAKVIK